MKKYLPVIIPHIKAILNTSLVSGIVPPGLKVAAVKPVLKKIGRDTADMSNYRPISNLPFVAKVLERVVVGQLQNHFSASRLLESFTLIRVSVWTQYGNFPFEGNESSTCCSRLWGILVLLDISAAFDTICHTILLGRFHKWIGLSGVALKWFESYLSERTQFLYSGVNRSQTVPLWQGVPQGSVLGPTLFSIYLLPLGQIIQKYGLG